MERVSRTAKLAEQLLRDRERRRDAIEARPDTECLKGASSDRPCGRSKPSPFLRQRLKSNPRPAMTQTTNRFFDEMARLMNDAAGVASGAERVRYHGAHSSGAHLARPRCRHARGIRGGFVVEGHGLLLNHLVQEKSGLSQLLLDTLRYSRSISPLNSAMPSLVLLLSQQSDFSRHSVGSLKSGLRCGRGALTFQQGRRGDLGSLGCAVAPTLRPIGKDGGWRTTGRAA
jgi:hypothetical protein